MNRIRAAVAGSLAAGLFVAAAPLAKANVTMYDAQVEGPFVDFPPLPAFPFIGTNDLIQTEIVELKLVSVSPIAISEMAAGDNGGGVGLPGDMGFGSIKLPNIVLPPLEPFEFRFEFKVLDPINPIPLVPPPSLDFDGTGFTTTYEYDSINFLTRITTFDFEVPAGQPVRITDAVLEIPPGANAAGTFEILVSMETLDFLNNGLPVLNFTLTGELIPAPAALALLGVAGVLCRRRRRRMTTAHR